MIEIQEQLSEVLRCVQGGVGANPHDDLVEAHWKNLCHIGSLALVKTPVCGKNQYLTYGKHAAVNGQINPLTHWKYETGLIRNIKKKCV